LAALVNANECTGFLTLSRLGKMHRSAIFKSGNFVTAEDSPTQFATDNLIGENPDAGHLAINQFCRQGFAATDRGGNEQAGYHQFSARRTCLEFRRESQDAGFLAMDEEFTPAPNAAY
jgi:hypothetical protein